MSMYLGYSGGAFPPSWAVMGIPAVLKQFFNVSRYEYSAFNTIRLE